MDKSQARRYAMVGFLLAVSVIAWKRGIKQRQLPVPYEFTGAAMLYGAIGIMAELSAQLATAFTLIYTVGLLYWATSGTTVGPAILYPPTGSNPASTSETGSANQGTVTPIRAQ